ncbi:MAG: phosphoribosylglycinamide formyltransferase [Firmicutes bacterium]|nr:phosphoribosylglycinamide formyltransferase [Bacillota bacterium]
MGVNTTAAAAVSGSGTGCLRLVVLVSGRGSNLQAILDAIEAGTLPARVCAVISDQPEAPALQRARARGVPAIPLPKRRGEPRDAYSARLAALCKEYQPELVVLAGFMRILGEPFLEAFPQRVINIHPALLPSFPGKNAQRQALEYGVRFSGCTVHFVDVGVDSGPIILQAVVPVLPDDTVEALSQRILREEHHLLPQAIALFAAGRLRVEGRRVRILPERTPVSVLL